MAGPAKRIWDAISHTSTLWGLLPSTWQAAVTAALATMTAYQGYQTGGLFVALLGAAAMVVLALMTIYFRLGINSLTSVFEKLSIPDIGVINMVAVGNPPSKIDFLTMSFTLRNDSKRLMYFRLKRASASMSQIVSPYTGVHKETLVLQPNIPQSVMMTTILNVPLPKPGEQSPRGRLELDIEYGVDRDKVEYTLHYISDLQLVLAANTDRQIVGAAIIGSIVELTHGRVTNG